MSARGTIAWHLGCASLYDQLSGMLAKAGDDERAAKNEGKAAGHAFRAAELAYDLGQRHAQERADRIAARRRVAAASRLEAEDAVTGDGLDGAASHELVAEASDRKAHAYLDANGTWQHVPDCEVERRRAQGHDVRLVYVD